MKFIDNRSITDPSLNLALEDHILQRIDTDESFLLFYINRPSIIIGRHQNTIEEINTSYVEAKSIQVVRRISGGGAVYHDLGNLNFSFITTKDPAARVDFRAFTEPVVRALHGMGVNAQLSGRNDITVDGRKISGNAQYFGARRMFSHGTLLFNSEIEHVVSALNVKPGKIESKGLKSIRSRVANISEYLHAPMTIEEFRQEILASVFEGVAVIPELELTQEDWDNVHRLAEEKYRSWEWNFGKSPAFNIQRVHRFSFGEIDLRMEVEKGVITDFRLFGDFFSLQDMERFERLWIGCPYARTDLAAVLDEAHLQEFFPDLGNEEFLTFIT